MSGSRKCVQLRRVVVPLLGVAVVLGSLTGIQSALSPAAQSVAYSSAVRSDEATANRGSGRSSEAALVLPETTLAPVAAVAETTTEAPSTSTTAVPTTLAPATAVPTTLAPATTAPTTTTAAPTTTVAPTAAPAAATSGNVETGKASYYDYKPGGCAHKTLPKGTVITVTNLSNGKSTTCVVNDRGPYIAGRIIDLETDVFKQVSSTSAGVFNARISW